MYAVYTEIAKMKSRRVLETAVAAQLVILVMGQLRNGQFPPEVSPEYVELTLLRAPHQLCLFDTVNILPNYKQLFEEGHIRGSRLFDLRRVTFPTPNFRYNVVHPSDFEKYARELGVHHSCHVVLYDHGEHPEAITTATRAWMLFRLYGHKRVSVMHGGLGQWRHWYHVVPMVTGPSEPVLSPGTFKAEWQSNVIASLQDVEWNFNANESVLIDARSRLEFEERDVDPAAAHPGHILTAMNIPLSSITRQHGVLKPVSELRQVFDTYGLLGQLNPRLRRPNDPNNIVKPAIVYCNDGTQASAVALALHLCGVRASVYNGGWIEFSKAGHDQFKVQQSKYNNGFRN